MDRFSDRIDRVASDVQVTSTFVRIGSDPRRKPGEWNLFLTKNPQSGKFDWLMLNPKGGGRGLAGFRYLGIAFRRAMQETDFQGAKRVWVVIEDFDQGKRKVLKSGWIPTGGRGRFDPRMLKP